VERKMIIMMEVRCCCQPEKLLGYLPADPSYHNASWIKRFEYSATAVQTETIGYNRVTLPIETIDIPGKPLHRAIKAEGMTIKDLEKLSGWRRK